MNLPLPNRSIACIDMKCFYASCIALLEGLDVMTVPIAIMANFNQPGSVVLAASPPMKERFRIKTGNRRYEIPRHPDIRLFEPKMSFFLDMSVAITKLIAQFVPREAIHVYSIDESFIDLTRTENLWGAPEETAKAIYNQYRIPSAVGIGPNMLMAKIALDLEAKKQVLRNGSMRTSRKSFGLFLRFQTCGGLARAWKRICIRWGFLRLRTWRIRS